MRSLTFYERPMGGVRHRSAIQTVQEEAKEIERVKSWQSRQPCCDQEGASLNRKTSSDGSNFAGLAEFKEFGKFRLMVQETFGTSIVTPALSNRIQHLRRDKNRYTPDLYFFYVQLTISQIFISFSFIYYFCCVLFCFGRLHSFERCSVGSCERATP